MIIDILLVAIILALILYIAYLQELHYAEIRGLLRKIGVEVEVGSTSSHKVTNKFKSITEKYEDKGGE